jgi:hypothetical protein
MAASVQAGGGSGGEVDEAVNAAIGFEAALSDIELQMELLTAEQVILKDVTNQSCILLRTAIVCDMCMMMMVWYLGMIQVM